MKSAIPSRSSDKAVLIRSFAASLLVCACAMGPDGGAPTGGVPRGGHFPTIPPGGDTVPPGGGGLVEVAHLYADRAAALELHASGAPVAPAGQPSVDEFVARTVVLSDGTFVDSNMGDPTVCPAVPAVTPTGRRRIVPAEYPTIQAAVDAADPGDVVAVDPGVYHESVRLRSNVSLIGSGAALTVLDGQGQGASLIDYTSAGNVVVQGFTLRGVGSAEGCAEPDNPFLCSGNWYAAAIYGDGHNVEDRAFGGDPCGDTSILIIQNVIRGNVIGVMTYFHARAVVRNNVFLGNRHAFVANHMQDHALVMNNAFVDNTAIAIGSEAAYLDVVGNLVAGSEIGVYHQFIQMGRVSCNVFGSVGQVGDRVPIGQDGNFTIDHPFVDAANGDFRPTPEVVAALSECLIGEAAAVPDWFHAEPGPYGGVLGLW